MSERGLEMSDIRTVLQPDVRLTRCQLADLFGVYYGTITANIKAIIKSGAVMPDFEGTLVQVGKTVLPERYDIEMVVALAFRLDSAEANLVRKWIISKAVTSTHSLRPNIFIRYSGGKIVD